MKSFIIIILLLSMNSILYSNDSTASNSDYELFFIPELGGGPILNNFAISGNFELKYKKYYSLRIGYGYGEASVNKLFSSGKNYYEFDGFAFMFNYIYGEKSQLELGTGVNFLEERNITGDKSWQRIWPAGSIAYRYAETSSYFIRFAATFVYGGGWPVSISFGFKLL